MKEIVEPTDWKSDPCTLRREAPSLRQLALDSPDTLIVTPSNQFYAFIRQEYNEYNRQTEPLAIVLPRSIDQLRQAVVYCSGHMPPIPMTIRGGGHDPYGRTVEPSAAQIDLRYFKWINILESKPSSSTATEKAVAVGPGITAIEMHRALDGAGLSAATGWAGSVGVVGWSCGGGYGLSSGAWGMGVDNILGAKVMQADGRIRDTRDDPDLLWAMRGAGQGNYGIIVELRIRVRPKPRYIAGTLVFSLQHAVKVLSGFQALLDEGLPTNFGGEMTINTTDALGPAINLYFTWICDSHSDAHVADGMNFKEKLLWRLQLAPLVDTVSETSTLAFHETLNQGIADSQHGYWDMASLTLARLTPEVIGVIMRNPAPTGGASAILVHHIHGRAVQPDDTASWSHRREHYVVSPCAIAPLDASPRQKQVTREWTQVIYREMLQTGQALRKGYWSMSRPENCDAIDFYGIDTVKRLTKLKQKLDPSNVFPFGLPRFNAKESQDERAHI
ncbi:FAD-binding oxidoreductase [Aspergillus luchuensis]|uniref:Uncharacterized protein n=1 Tax=Aspergillus kawachii TaxID=1069201 RepID=A0A7R7WJW4_ASPKA|nr:uncharacterized protein AKAW2_70883A [Aspergillus luchuensis]BCS04005.1 hypothetical protein AKAW2_70883A [Aspergillus luchuensis]BCS15609.1 hypothetical protein ALUC_70842A [Aspergillus luchuensis]GAA89818.1 FAD binding domain protein [Aspergillus luchuensis IFO 4308]